MHGERRMPLGMAVGLCDMSLDHKAVAVLHQGVAHIAKLGLLAFALSMEPGVGVCD